MSSANRTADGLQMSRRIRRTPYTDSVEACGVRGFSVVNHMLLPKAFQTTVEEDYWHLREHVQLWDVSCQRQVEIRGPDAKQLVQWMTPRDLSGAEIGQCLYVPLTDAQGGVINDPVLLKLAENHYWLSIADSDVRLWAEGLALGKGLDVTIDEPDVSPLAVQGPKAEALMIEVFGDAIRDIGFFRYAWLDFQGTQQLIARSGYSRQGGFEIYLDSRPWGLAAANHFKQSLSEQSNSPRPAVIQNNSPGKILWDTLWKAGQAFNIRPGCPNLIERIEGGLLSYGNEMHRENNPLECDLGVYCQLERHDFIGREALQNIAKAGVTQQIRGVLFEGDPCPTCSIPWPVLADGLEGEIQIGQITSAIYSPRLKHNVGQSMIARKYWEAGTAVRVQCHDGSIRDGEIVTMPFA